MNTNLKNPYVGPRTFQREDRNLFFGREREARDLMALVSSERLVLFYAQSGAGKSSLLNTRLLPELEGTNFEVLPVGRVQGSPPAGVDVENIYIYNLMASIVRNNFAPQSLVGISLSQFLAVLEPNAVGYLFSEESLAETIQESRWPRILIIDQFEEIFTTNLASWKKRDDFFRQLAHAMQDDPYLTVVLIMREDYIAALDPYAHLLPGGLRMRYYMQRLSRDAALRAVKNPTAGSRPYADGVAERLVDDLASIVVQKPDGTQEVHAGQYIEPVQLQVVCYGLWDDLPPEAAEITTAHILEIGDVDKSLERFYDRRMAAVSSELEVPERLIREWFEKELITSGRTRDIVLQNTNHNARLGDDVIQTMRGDLVRAELRAGQVWYELSHDRLIDPVLASNAKWFEGHLSMFQQRVVLWAQQGQSESLLLRDQELEDAEREAANLTLTMEEQDFLKDCRALQKRIQRDRRQRRVITVALIAVAILFVVAGLLAIQAKQETTKANNSAATAKSSEATAQSSEAMAKTQESKAQVEKNNAEQANATAQASEKKANEQASIALAGSLAAQANSLKNSDHALALLLGVEAYKREADPKLLTKPLLFDLLQFTPYVRIPLTGPVSNTAVSPDGNWIAVASCKDNEAGDCNVGDIRLYDESLEQIMNIPGEVGVVYSLAFHQYDDKLILAAGGCVPEGCSIGKGQITLRDIANRGIKQREAHTSLVKSIAFSKDGKFLASGSYDTTILLWDVSDPANPEQVGIPLDHNSFVNDISFSPDGNYLASAGDDRSIYIWNISQKENIPQPETYNEHAASVTSIIFSPDGRLLASAGDDNAIFLWDWKSGKLSNPKKLVGHIGYVKTIAFNAEGSMLASAGFDNTILLWDAGTGEQFGPPLVLHTKAINSLAFGSFSGEPYLISASNDRTFIKWDLSTRNPVNQSPDYLESLDAENWTEKACVAAKRNLTEEEWMKYLPNQTYEKTCPGIE